MDPQDKIIKLELVARDVNQILVYLMKQKYSQVYKLIVDIQQQAVPQVNGVVTNYNTANTNNTVV
jgi:hypothetical protein